MKLSALWNGRRFGVLLHISSLPGGHGIGDAGPKARRFVDWLAASGARLWQVLPLCPPGGPRYDVPYASQASLSAHPQLISLDDLVTDGLLEPEDLPHGYDEGWVSDAAVRSSKAAPLARAADRLLDGHPLREAFDAFARAPWITEAGLFAVLHREHRGQPWWTWPPSLRRREPGAIEAARRRHHRALEQFAAQQFMFDRQWQALRAYARAHHIDLIGDVPIYVHPDAADVWNHQTGFRIDTEGRLEAVSGAPPDEFSADSQRWGGPLYDWPRMAEDNYGWWRRRLARAFNQADAVRLDHFRAFAAHWEIPARADSAKAGRWVPGPGLEFFDAVRADLGPRPFCVEDLGAIDDDVIALREALGFPGMRVLHYGFGGDAHNPHLPHNHPDNAIVYPANHDNNTTLGWWRGLSPEHRSHVQHYLGRHGDDIVWDLNRAALASAAHSAIIQMQDVLALGSEARMNDPTSYARPATTWTNWRWRLRPGQASLELAERLHFLAALYGRV